MPLMNGLLIAIKLVELNNKIIVLILSDHDNIKCMHKFNIFNKPIPISTLMNIVNEKISISLSIDNKI